MFDGDQSRRLLLTGTRISILLLFPKSGLMLVEFVYGEHLFSCV